MTETVENQQLQTMEDALDSVLDIKPGDVVKGDVLAFEDNQVRVSIKESGGLEGVIPRRELSAKPFNEFTEVVNIGDEVEVVVLKPIRDKENGNFLLSRKRLESKKVWAELKEKFDNKEIITAPVKEAVKGGLVVDLGLRAFVPASMVDSFYVEDLKVYVGQTLDFVIVELDEKENRLILSHKEIAERERAEKRAAALANLVEGSIVEGTVARLTNFGAFVNLGDVDGLVNVKVLSVNPEDGRVSLSIKDTLEGPWDNIQEKAGEGTVLKGTVKRLTDFGAFVEVLPGVEGLVHISQISHEHIATPGEKLQEGQEVDVKVLSVNPEDQRLSLSIKALLERPARPEGEVSDKPKRESKPRKPRAKAEPAPTIVAEAEGFTLGDVLAGAFGDLNTEE